MKIGIKEIGKELTIVDDNTKYRSDLVKKYIKCDKAEFVPIGKTGLSIAVDEAGLPKELPSNFLISTNSPHWPIQKMVGTVVFTRIKEIDYSGEIYDYEVTDLTARDIELINNMISRALQQELERKFEDYSYGSVTPVIERFNSIEQLQEYLEGKFKR